MRALFLLLFGMVLGVAAVVTAGALLLGTDVGSRAEPGRVETTLARAARHLAIPASARARMNPVPVSDAVLTDGMEHFADHCAVCHANDGSGNIEMGRGLYPRAPDMRLAATQNLSDGELFAIIENGVRFTGMPAWTTGTPAGETSTWHLVHFIRHLPRVTAAELDRMKALNPQSPETVREEIEEERFLNQGANP